jgi:sugar lactone lactonase YvrE
MIRRGIALAILASGCARKDAATVDQQPRLIATVSGFETPESVRYDGARDVFYVSNVTGNPTAKDNNGFISRVRADGTMDSLRFISGGVNGATLHSPKGMFLAGDTLWVADIDAVRAFSVASGASLFTVDFAPAGALLLNDITRSPDGTFYVSDTRLAFGDSGVTHRSPDRVYRFGTDRSISVAIENDTLGWPNGVLWDQEGQRLLVVAIGQKRIFEWKPGDAAPRLIAEGPGGYDGIEPLGAGRFILSAQDDSSISILENGMITRLIPGIESPGDIGWDPARRRVLVPLLGANQVVIWQIP